MKQAIILCSGGLDSATTAFLVGKNKKYGKIKVLFFNYGQRSLRLERKASKYVASRIKAYFQEIPLSALKSIAEGPMTKKEKVVQSKSLKDTSTESDAWYVPCRNLVFLSHALAIAEKDFVDKKMVSDIYVGFKSEGKEPYPDTTEGFVASINSLSKQSCAYPFKVIAPLIKMDKEDIISLAVSLGLETEKTYSCYVGKNKQCGTCLACKLRRAGFYWANVKDKTDYLEDFKALE